MINDARKATPNVGETTTWGTKLKGIITDDRTRAVMKEAFSADQIKNIDNIADWGMMTQTPTKGGGAMLIQLTQAGAVANLFALPFEHGAARSASEGASAGLLLTPPILSKLMASKQGAYWLSRGVKLPANSPEAMGVVAKLVNLAKQANAPDENRNASANEDYIGNILPQNTTGRGTSQNE